MKKILSLLMAVLTLWSLTACSSAPEPVQETAAATHIVVDHNGNEVGCIQNCLHGFLEFRGSHFIEHQGKNDRCRGRHKGP